MNVNVVNPVADFHRPPEVPLIKTNILHPQISHPQPLVTAGYGDRVSAHTKGLNVLDQAADNVTAPAQGRHFDTILGTVVKLVAYESEVAHVNPYEGSTVRLVNGLRPTTIITTAVFLFIFFLRQTAPQEWPAKAVS